MQHVIATDEAGYGPNLGPLVIGGTRWASETADFGFEEALSDFVFATKSRLTQFEKATGSAGLMIADSKAVYSSGKIELLERGVLASLFAVHQTIPGNAGQLMCLLGVDPSFIQDSEYFQCNDTQLPLATGIDVVQSAGSRIADSLLRSGAELKELSVATVFPKRFNQSVQRLGNKASCLTAESLTLVSNLMRSAKAAEDDRFDIRCDKHGGRNRYAPAIEQHFGDARVTIEEESRPRSRYCFRDGRASIEFAAKGETWLPIALASMCAKYVREIYMQRWNRFWQVHLPHLKPTKGYPVDARRFKQDIDSLQKKIGIADEDIWRFR